VFTIAKAAIAWTNRRQGCISLPTTKAEYVTTCATTKEAIWLQQLLGSMGVPQTFATLNIVTNKVPFDWSRTLNLWTNWLKCLQNHLLLIRLDTFASSWELFLNLLYPSMLEVEVHTYMFHVLHIESICK
jgi:hypothetical protein